MSLGVFLSFRRCPKHPNTPTFDFRTPILPNLATRSGGDMGRLGEIAMRLIGGSGELSLSS